MDCADFVRAFMKPGWMFSFAVCAFVSFTVALSGGVVFAAFCAYFVKTFT